MTHQCIRRNVMGQPVLHMLRGLVRGADYGDRTIVKAPDRRKSPGTVGRGSECHDG